LNIAVLISFAKISENDGCVKIFAASFKPASSISHENYRGCFVLIRLKARK